MQKNSIAIKKNLQRPVSARVDPIKSNFEKAKPIHHFSELDNAETKGEERPKFDGTIRKGYTGKKKENLSALHPINNLKQKSIMDWTKKNFTKRIIHSAYVIHPHDVNIIDELKNTPIYYACKNGNLEITKYLIKHGSLINEYCQLGNTPMHMAFKSGNIELITYLKPQGADLNSVNEAYQTPIAFGTNKV